MLRLSLIYGLLAGAVVIGSIIIGMAFGGPENAGTSPILGYLIMIVALSLIFFGVRRYRDTQNGGTISFLKAAGMGLLITFFAGVVYVLVWEVYVAVTGSSFIEAYAEAYIAEQRAAGLAGDELDALVASMDAMKANYTNPLFRIPVTFLEIAPVGLVISVISAAILRKPAQGSLT